MVAKNQPTTRKADKTSKLRLTRLIAGITLGKENCYSTEFGNNTRTHQCSSAEKKNYAAQSNEPLFSRNPASRKPPARSSLSAAAPVVETALQSSVPTHHEEKMYSCSQRRQRRRGCWRAWRRRSESRTQIRASTHTRSIFHFRQPVRNISDWRREFHGFEITAVEESFEVGKQSIKLAGVEIGTSAYFKYQKRD